ncbi:efflux RND transporter periplasmic adaptor subunit [Reyranella sp.]|uniref:efflux RND transporter periplasmic adaptor subunit n=1 Tax=Reyranella sp. TaxID=1929291 RepID=UPI0025D61F43|nr:efflux RND transporter periplasmic adaptor subunit [Reyranella sp.]
MKALVPTLLALVCGGFVVCCSAFAQQPASVPLAVLVQPAEARPLAAQREFIGRAQALDKVDLRARVQGFLGARKFKDGDLVKQGELLFVIEPEPYQATVEQREGQKAAAEGAVANADVQFRRAQELARTNVGTQQTLDQRTAELIAAKGALTEADAALKDAKIKLSYTDVRSPIAGRIGRANVPPGNVVGPESGVLATVVAEQPMLVLFSVTQRELLEARRGGSSGEAMKAKVRLADDTLHPEEGTLDFIDVQVDPRTDGQTLRASFPNTDGRLTDGQTVRVILEEKQAANVVMVPQSVVASDQSGYYLFVVGPDNKAEQRRIKLGPEREGAIVVEEGLKAGEKVIVQGQQRVRPGMVVAPELAPAAEQSR